MASSSEQRPLKKAKVVSALERTVTLNNGVEMPMVGFGTYKLKEGEVASATKAALEAGYKLVDTAFVYGGGKTEGLLGRALEKKKKGHDNDSDDSPLFVITKQWRGEHGYAPTSACLETSLKRLGKESVDLWLMHWPGPGYSAMGRSKKKIAEEGIQTYFKKGHEDPESLRLETWRAMEDALEAGKCRAIGVSNFSAAHLRKLLAWKDLRHKPAVNQIEFHPYLQQRDVLDVCAEHDIQVQAYASLGGQDTNPKDWVTLGHPPLAEHPAVTDAAKAHDTTAVAVLLQWALQKNIAIIPKSKSPTRIRQNAVALGSFALSDAEMANIDSLDLGGMGGRLCWRRDEMRLLDFD
mmetsp:Transcript_26630/g.86224  ORF Transcript_26630/g.86224 Transcript_26630/m.86224 type:complete len:351 (-) Transcript_26630:1752-2804(-)